jgi:hypothetical protein
MLLVYVDDVLAISHELKILIDAIGEYDKVKPGSDKEPDIYLGANVKKVQMQNGREVWATSPHDCQECYQDCQRFTCRGWRRVGIEEQSKEPISYELSAQVGCIE